MIVENTHFAYPHNNTMNSYPNILTPPSSNEDSTQPLYYVASPNSGSFQGLETYDSMDTSYITQHTVMMNPNDLMDVQQGAYLEFVEQPTDRFRFRYKSEMAGTHGSLNGVNSDKSRKQTFPTVEVKNGVGKVIVRCSIYQTAPDVTKMKDFMPHAHRLIMKKGKEEQDDPHDLEIGPEEGYRAIFHGMGIIHTAKKNIITELTRKKTQLKQESIARNEGKIRELTTRELLEIKGLAESESKSINLNIVCLRFDAFIKNNDGILFPLCKPIYSHGINNLKSALTGDLKIVRLDHCVSEAKGGKEIFILVERVTKKNIKIRFYETDDNDQIVWEGLGHFNDLDVHHQYAIVFKTPEYRYQDITRPVNVFVELLRPSDNARSEPRDFRYIPNKDIGKSGRKRARYDYSSSSYNSSNIGSDELPVVLNSLRVEPPENILGNLNNIPSEELQRAMQDMGSEDFKHLFDLHSEEFNSVLGIDAPKFATGASELGADHQMNTQPIIVKAEVTKEEEIMAHRVLQELRSFMKSKPTESSGIKMLKHYLGANRKTNALHVAICQKDTMAIKFLLTMIIFFKQFDLIEKENTDSQTPLHLSVIHHNEYMVMALLTLKAKISAGDNNLNTPLHFAVINNVSNEILELLLRDRSCEKVSEYVDSMNDNGDTALIMAIKRRHMAAIKLLCMKGADFNRRHDKNGFVPLRFAIEYNQTDVVKYLLTLPDLDASITDYQNVSPLSRAMSMNESEDITNTIMTYMEERGITAHVKEEVDSEEEEEEDMDLEEPDVKPPIPMEELEKQYKDVTNFTSKCLDEVSAILDKSGKWRFLSELLSVDHLIDSGVINSEHSMSKALLVYCVETNLDSLWMIRGFLENLDEDRAVQAMDAMVRES